MSPNQIRQFTHIARAIEYLYDHAAEQPDLAQVAAAVHVSPEHLQREFSAWAGYLAHPLPWLFLAAFVAYMTRFQIMPEERVLAQKFGTEYESYCRRVRRWL